MLMRSGWQLSVIIAILGRIDGGNRVFFFGPRAQIDLFASFGAKRTELVFFLPFDLAAAGRAIDKSGHDVTIQKLQRVRSNGTSPSKVFGFILPSCEVKRTQSMYLLADISGM